MFEEAETQIVDGRNPAPPEMYKTLFYNGINYLSTVAGFPPSTVLETPSFTETPQSHPIR